jgi:hypothetical protein
MSTMTKIGELANSVSNLVAEYGATIVQVHTREGENKFWYTVGLAKYGHKDIIMYGANGPDILRTAMVQVMGGKVMPVNKEVDGVMHNYPVQFKDLLLDIGNEDCWQARKWYLENDVEEVGYMQLVFPDKQRLWPWDDGCNEVVRECQVCSFLPQ